MAHKKGVGSSRNGRESHSKRLGVKVFGGSMALAGNIIVRQRGTQHFPGLNVGMGKDHTLYALRDGKVVFKKKHGNKSYVSVEPVAAEVTAVPAAKTMPLQSAPQVTSPADTAIVEDSHAEAVVTSESAEKE